MKELGSLLPGLCPWTWSTTLSSPLHSSRDQDLFLRKGGKDLYLRMIFSLRFHKGVQQAASEPPCPSKKQSLSPWHYVGNIDLFPAQQPLHENIPVTWFLPISLLWISLHLCVSLQNKKSKEALSRACWHTPLPKNRSMNEYCQIQGHLYDLNAPWRMKPTLHNISLAFAFSVLSVLGDKELHPPLPAHGIFGHVERWIWH